MPSASAASGPATSPSPRSALIIALQNRFYLLRTLGFAQLANGDRGGAEATYKLAFDEYRKDADSRDMIVDDLVDDYPGHRKDNADDAKALAKAFKSKKWIALPSK